jgi:integrase
MEKLERGLYKRAGAHGAYVLRYVNSEGKYCSETAGYDKEIARALLRKRQNARVIGEKLPELRVRGILFDEIAEDAMRYVRGRYSRPADDLSRLKLLKEMFAGRPIRSMTPAEIEGRLMEEQAGPSKLRPRRRGEWSASSYNHQLTLVSLAFKLARRAKKTDTRPELQKQSEGPGRTRYLRPEEEQKLRFVIRAKPSWADHEPELDLAINTGLRRGSMYLDLVWENVDLVARKATISRTKNGDPVEVPLNAAALRALAEFRSRGDGTGRVVRNVAGETLNVTAHWFVEAVKAAGIKNFRWHDLRHTYATRLRKKGVSLFNIADLLGHKGLAMTRRYAHVDRDDLQEAVERLDGSFSHGTPVVLGPEAAPPAPDRVN